MYCKLQHIKDTITQKVGSGYVAMLRAAGGEVVTRLAEVESGVRGAGAGTHWDMLLGAPLLRHQTQYHPRIMIEMSCSGGLPDETSILTMSPFRETDNQ